MAKGLDSHTTIDNDHGRIETRTTRVCHATGWLANQRKAPGEPRFDALAAIVETCSEVEHKGKTTTARRFFISSAPMSAERAAHAVRAHWGIENRLHWVMDVVFHDDLMRLRTDNGPANMATMRHTALNIIKAIPGKESLKVKRKSVGWDDQRLIKAIKNNHQ